MNDNSPKKWKENNKDVERAADPKENGPVVRRDDVQEIRSKPDPPATVYETNQEKDNGEHVCTPVSDSKSDKGD